MTCLLQLNASYCYKWTIRSCLPQEGTYQVVGIEATLSSELESVNAWLINNKLLLHLGKTQSIVFGTKRKLCKCNTVNIVCNGNATESTSTITYLGMTLDQSLSGDAIASDVLSKMSNKLKFLYRNGRKFNKKK